FVSYLKNWDKISAKRPDKYLAISSEVKNRIKKYYNEKSEVMFPPFTILNKVSNKKTKIYKKDEYFLVVSRLTNFYKRVDIAIKACNKLNLNLKIVGTGRDEGYLRKIAGPTIEFLGDLTDEKLSFYYKNSKALIFPGREDFCLAMVEAQYFGKPVIAFRGGGALDIVKEGVTGEFFSKQDEKSLVKTLEKFSTKSYNSKLCKENVEKFSFKIFKRNLLEFIEKNKV
ncbi:MAG TPA: glycosyltransferase, partial [Candidatus Sulfotelmatobacter sp.]|nr:glycosyltransferase [Candidatus Sulfotelmatobacter sp.]